MTYMDTTEILRRYKSMRRHNRIKVLAELNATTPDEIRAIVRGVEPEPEKKRRTKKLGKLDPVKAKQMYEQGASDKRIAAAFLCSDDYVGNWRRKNFGGRVRG